MGSRTLAALLAAIALSGCGSSEKKAPPAPWPGTFETKKACQDLATKLAALPAPDGAPPTIELLSIKNETNQSLDTHPIEDELRGTLADSKRFTVLMSARDREELAETPGATPPGKPSDFLLVGSLSGTNMKGSDGTSVRTVRYSFQIANRATRAIVVESRSDFREVRQ